MRRCERVLLSEKGRKNRKIQWNLMMGGTTLVALPVLILFLFLQRYFISTNISAGIK